MAESVLNSDVAAVAWAAATGASAREAAQNDASRNTKGRPSKARQNSRPAPGDVQDASTDSFSEPAHEIDSFA